MGMKAAVRTPGRAPAAEAGKMMILRGRAIERHTDDAHLPQPMIFRLARELGLDIKINGLGEADWQKIEAALDDGSDKALDEMYELVDSMGGEEAMDVIKIESANSRVTLIWDEDRLSRR